MRHAISTNDAPKAIGPYSQAVRAGSLVFVSGQGHVDPATGEVVAAGPPRVTPRDGQHRHDLRPRARRSRGAAVYLADMNDFAAMNAAYAEYFSSPAPARTTIQAARLPKDLRVEIDVIASL